MQPGKVVCFYSAPTCMIWELKNVCPWTKILIAEQQAVKTWVKTEDCCWYQNAVLKVFFVQTASFWSIPCCVLTQHAKIGRCWVSMQHEESWGRLLAPEGDSERQPISWECDCWPSVSDTRLAESAPQRRSAACLWFLISHQHIPCAFIQSSRV